MTDEELKDLVANLAINQQKMSEEAALARKEDHEMMALAREEDQKMMALYHEEAVLARKEDQKSMALAREEDHKMMALYHEKSVLAREEDQKSMALYRKEMALSWKKNDKAMKELRQQIGGIANKFGSFTEGLALPSMTKILAEKFGMTTINPSVRVRDKQGNEHEIDVLAYANSGINTAFIVEVKSHLREEGIEQLINQCRLFSSLFPTLADKKLYGILAAVDANEQLQKKVLAKGLYFAKIHDEQFSLHVPKKFKPYCFNPR